MSADRPQRGPPLLGSTVRHLECSIRMLRDRIEEAQDELTVAEAALTAARKREEEMAKAKKEDKK